MTDPVRPLVFVVGDGNGICDPETGVCAIPAPDMEPDDMEPVEVVSEPQ